MRSSRRRPYRSLPGAALARPTTSRLTVVGSCADPGDARVKVAAVRSLAVATATCAAIARVRR
jgi:hypothetical protein